MIHAQLAIYYEVVAVYVQAFTVPVGGPARRGGPTAQLVYRLLTPFAELGSSRTGTLAWSSRTSQTRPASWSTT